MEARENKSDNQSDLDSSRNENSPARLRRLRIQQNILQKGIKYLYSKLQEDDTFTENKEICRANDNNIYFDKIKKMFTEIKHLYEEIRFLTDESNTAKTSDIDEIRKNILLLETKIKEFKKYLEFELDKLKNEEVELCKHQITLNKTVRKVTSTMPYKLISPSPVKVLIESPFKCLEVQEFQEFMTRTKRYGGWNEYDHNKFINIWNSYFGCAGLDNCQEININKSETFSKLIDEVMDKNFGFNREDIISHVEWYIQYLKLYTSQKNALNKWKVNRNTIKKYNRATRHNEERIKQRDNGKCHDVKPQKTSSISSNDSLFSNLSLSSEKSSDGLEIQEKVQKIKKTSKSKLMEPTKQWLYRCNDRTDTTAICNIETVRKLSTPSWRVGLQ